MSGVRKFPHLVPPFEKGGLGGFLAHRPLKIPPNPPFVKGEGERLPHALAVELLNDWEAIFQVLSHPELPLMNNEAERTLRHWVILRRLGYSIRTDVGSRVFALLASVIDTCRRRGHSPWRYLEQAIADRRAGQPLTALRR